MPSLYFHASSPLIWRKCLISFKQSEHKPPKMSNYCSHPKPLDRKKLTTKKQNKTKTLLSRWETLSEIPL